VFAAVAAALVVIVATDIALTGREPLSANSHRSWRSRSLAARHPGGGGR
jgi:hypothetical protein